MRIIIIKKICEVHYAMKTRGGVEVYLQYLWPRHSMEVSGQLYAPTALSQGTNSGTHWTCDCVDSRTGLNAVERKKILPSPGIESRPSRQYPIYIYTEWAIQTS
jgi:hypothetical protein